ncbi:hypothetical protein [Micromonospora marina]|uniref:hypothetical protein n=1 Tax=Micromonospora marina TaxID=307120 RepID=UPI003D758E59
MELTDFALMVAYIALVLLTLAWPLLAFGTAALPLWGLVGLVRARRQTSAADRARRQRRSQWLLTAGPVLTALATYGYGLSRMAAGLPTDPDDRCRIAMRGRMPYDPERSGGSSSIWPLHDTTCGPELVPAFVNPLVAGAGAVSVVLLATMAWVTIRARQSTPPEP